MGTYAVMYINDGATEATVSIAEEGTIHKTIDNKYLGTLNGDMKHKQLVTNATGETEWVDRLAYPIPGTVEILSKAPIANAQADSNMVQLLFNSPLNGTIEVGKTYSVNLGGACIFSGAAKILGEGADIMTVIGNTGLVGGENTGEPFMVAIVPNSLIPSVGGTVMAAVPTSLDLSEGDGEYLTITGDGMVYKTVPFEYLPEGVGGVGIGYVLPEVTLEALEADDGMMAVTTPLNASITVGNEYTVVWNGTEYRCIAQGVDAEGTTIFVLGNMAADGGTDTGEPFLIVDGSLYGEGIGLVIMPLDGSTTATLSISGEIIKKIPSKYLDLGASADNPIILTPVEGSATSFTASVDFETAFALDENKLQSAIRIGSSGSVGSDGMSVYAVSKIVVGSLRCIQMLCIAFNDYEQFDTEILQWWAGGNAVGVYTTRGFIPKNSDSETAIPMIHSNSAIASAVPLTSAKEQMGITQLEQDVSNIKNGTNVDGLIAAVIAALPVYDGEVVTE